MKNIILVEGEQDKRFIEQVLVSQNLIYTRVQEVNVNVMNGENALKNQLQTLKEEAEKGKITHLGIVIDMDNHTLADRLLFINNAFAQAAWPNVNLTQINELISCPIDEYCGVKIGCYFMNYKGQGNLEDVLIHICSQNTTFADALQCWRDCFTQNGKSIKQSEYNKQWLQFYARYDCCNKKEATQAAKNCTMHKAFEKGSFDLNNPVLFDLHQFLNLFQ